MVERISFTSKLSTGPYAAAAQVWDKASDVVSKRMAQVAGTWAASVSGPAGVVTGPAASCVVEDFMKNSFTAVQYMGSQGWVAGLRTGGVWDATHQNLTLGVKGHPAGLVAGWTDGSLEKCLSDIEAISVAQHLLGNP